jgi:hypothetical protein
MLTPARAIATYIEAKDGNRPFLMPRAFAANAAVEMIVKTDAISFPSALSGRDAITDVLIRQFAASYENVHTFCLAPPPAARMRLFSCAWLVGMSSRKGGEIRVGCGRYDWTFGAAADGLVERLKITIEQMEILPPERLAAVMGWLAALSYPWCSIAEAVQTMPALSELAALATYIKTRA